MHSNIISLKKNIINMQYALKYFKKNVCPQKINEPTIKWIDKSLIHFVTNFSTPQNFLRF